MSSMEMSRVNVSEMIEYLLLRYDAMFRQKRDQSGTGNRKELFRIRKPHVSGKSSKQLSDECVSAHRAGKADPITLKKEKKQIRMEVYKRWRAD